MRFFVLLVVIFTAFIFPSASLAREQAGVNQTALNAREYLPGDFVHIVVDAPSDTTQMSATMPDNTIVSLVQQRVSGLWRGIWQVPVNFAAGTYTSKLTAVDIQGNVFEGQSDSFHVSELTMINLVGKASQEVIEKAPLQEKVTVEAVAKTAFLSEQELLKMIGKLIAQPIPGPAPALRPSEKDAMVERNLVLGRENMNQKRYAEAANYFRVVLYLSPSHKIAGYYLIEAQSRKEQQKAQRSSTYSLVAIGISFSLLLLFMLIRILNRRPTAVSTAPPKETINPELSGEEKARRWYMALAWKDNPFTADVFKQLFAEHNRLEFDGFKNLIKARIESVGGCRTNPFTDSALEKIYALSKGKPKEAMQICKWVVDQAIKYSRQEITAEQIKEYEATLQRVILVVDDEEIVRASLKAILTKGGGYEVDFAFDGEEALRKIKHNHYGVILLDIEMPGPDGYEILKQVREQDATLPVIFVTGKGSPKKTMESIARHNLTGYIEKPFTPEKVLDMVARTIKA